MHKYRMMSITLSEKNDRDIIQRIDCIESGRRSAWIKALIRERMHKEKEEESCKN